MKGGRVVVVLACAAGTAHAGPDTSQLPPQDTLPAPPPPAPPAAASTPAPGAQPAVAAANTATTRLADRSGPAFMAGVELVPDGHYARLDAMMPVSLPAAPQLRVGLVLGFTHSRASVPDLTLEAYGFGVYAMASYDWKLPLRATSGDFVITADGGFGAGIARLKVDEPFMPGHYENLVGYGIRVASQLQYRGTNGLIVAVQYVGLSVPLNTPRSPNPDVEVSSDITYAFALLAGYQL